MITRGRVLSQAEDFDLEMRRLEWNRQQQRVPRVRPALRQRIDELLAAGWSITGRDPVRIERGVRVLQVRGGALIDG